MIASAPRSSHTIRINAGHHLDPFPALFALLRPALSHLSRNVVERLPPGAFIPQSAVLVRREAHFFEDRRMLFQLRDAFSSEREPLSQRGFRAPRASLVDQITPSLSIISERGARRRSVPERPEHGVDRALAEAGDEE